MKEEYEKTISDFQEVIKKKPRCAEAHCNLGVAYYAVGDRGSALNEHKILKDLDKDLANELFNLMYK